MINFDKKLVDKIFQFNSDKDISYYVYDLDEINKNIDNITNNMPTNFYLYYAMKANSNKKVLEHIKLHNGISGFEIASSGELEKAKKYCSTNEIIFTGPAKTEKELELAILNKIELINVESVVEAIRINDIAEKLNVDKVNILLRINMDYKIEDAAENMGGLSTKMGIDEKQYNESYEYIKQLKHLNILGIHVFSASGILNYKAAIEYAEYVFEIVKKLENKGQKIEIIDLGGGLGVDYTNENKQFDVKKYFVELQSLIQKYNYSNKKFILELGCYLVANAGYYLSKIVDIKNSKNYKHIILAGGLNHIPTATLNGKHPFYIVNINSEKIYENQPSVLKETVDIDGPLCTAEDKVLWSVYVDNANIGDVIVIKQAGAYCYSAAWLEFLSHDYPVELSMTNKETLENISNI